MRQISQAQLLAEQHGAARQVIRAAISKLKGEWRVKEQEGKKSAAAYFHKSMDSDVRAQLERAEQLVGEWKHPRQDAEDIVFLATIGLDSSCEELERLDRVAEGISYLKQHLEEFAKL